MLAQSDFRQAATRRQLTLLDHFGELLQKTFVQAASP